MLNRLPLLLVTLIVFGLPVPSQASEHPSARTAPVAEETRSTVKVLPGVRLNWSSATSGEILSPEILKRADVSHSRTVSKETKQVTIYVDFS